MKQNLVGTADRPGYRYNDSRFLIAAVAYTLIFAVSYISTVQAQNEQGTGMPQLTIKEKIHDFGTAVEGEKITHDFVLKNRGTSVIEIKKVKTG